MPPHSFYTTTDEFWVSEKDNGIQGHCQCHFVSYFNALFVYTTKSLKIRTEFYCRQLSQDSLSLTSWKGYRGKYKAPSELQLSNLIRLFLWGKSVFTYLLKNVLAKKYWMKTILSRVQSPHLASDKSIQLI